MASKKSIVELILFSLSDAGDITAKKVFGDYGLFLSGRMIGFIADDRLLFKPTSEGRRLFHVADRRCALSRSETVFSRARRRLEQAGLVGSSGDRYCRRASSSQKEAKEESKECLNSSGCRHQSVARRLPQHDPRAAARQSSVNDGLEARAGRPREYCPCIARRVHFASFAQLHSFWLEIS